MSEKKETVLIDQKLPQMDIALSPVRMEKLLREAISGKQPQLEVQNCQVNYLRYKPQTTCLVGYSVTLKDKKSDTSFEHLFYAKLYQESDFKTARQKLAKRPYSSFDGLPPVSFWPDFNLVLFSFPNDRLMKPLKWVVDPHKLKRIVLPYFSQYAQGWRVRDHHTKIAAVRYKPERRSVLHCEMKLKSDATGQKAKEKFFVRVYADDTGKMAQKLSQRLNNSAAVADKKINIPKVLGYNDQLKLLVISELPGKPLLELLGQSEFERALQKTALMLENLHTLKVETERRWNLQEEIAVLNKQSELISTILPESEGKMKDLISKLEKKAAFLSFSSSHLLHGDFYYGQVLVDQEQVWFLDLDEALLGDPLLDVGNFVAHLQYQSLMSPEYPWTNYLNHFQISYWQKAGENLNPQKLAWFKAYALMKLAIWPFRTLKSNWQKITEQILDLAVREAENVT